MEYVVFLGAMLAFILFLTVQAAWVSRKQDKWFEKKLREDYGKAPEKKYRPGQLERIGCYFRKHPVEGQIDDITWNDLNMDDIFIRMNHALSAAGEEYLYFALRTPHRDPEALKALEAMTEYFSKHEDERVRIQMLMRRLGGNGKYSLYDYLEYLSALGKRSNLKHILLDAAFLPLIVLCFFMPSVAFTCMGILMVYNITTYFREKKEIDPYIVSFAYVMRLLDVCGKLSQMHLPVCEENWRIIRSHRAQMSRMRRGSFWVLSGSRGGNGGSPLDAIMDYVRMAFHVDLIEFNKMLYELNRHLEDVDALVGQVGLLETAISVGAYRASLKNGWCLPEFSSDGELILTEMYHPLIANPVKNSISTRRGVLLTGSNASGKSTFLKTVAVCSVLSQTINTCPAERFQSPFYRIYSSMSLRDDIDSGESYYIVEIKAMKRILDAAKQEGRVLCFVDEVLRGTNTVERIAASTQILKSLAADNLLCFAATHDIELTELLQDEYENYHFEEDVRDGDVLFNYKLLHGKAVTRNAIRLLEIMGYDASIIERAKRQAERFVTTGRWEM